MDAYGRPHQKYSLNNHQPLSRRGLHGVTNLPALGFGAISLFLWWLITINFATINPSSQSSSCLFGFEVHQPPYATSFRALSLSLFLPLSVSRILMRANHGSVDYVPPGAVITWFLCRSFSCIFCISTTISFYAAHTYRGFLKWDPQIIQN